MPTLFKREKAKYMFVIVGFLKNNPKALIILEVCENSIVFLYKVSIMNGFVSIW